MQTLSKDIHTPEGYIKQMQAMVTAIKDAKTAIVLAHVNPDGDTLGSMLALARVLEKSGLLRVDRIMHDRVPEIYKFFPDSEKVLCSQEKPELKQLLKGYDLSFSCDCGSVERLGTGGDVWRKGNQTGNVDHHLSNPLFANLNLVDPEATSTGQVVYELAQTLGVEIDEELASLMYITLLTDTGGFRHSNSNSKALAWGAQLIDLGADASYLYNKLFNQMPYKTIKVIGEALNKIVVYELLPNGELVEKSLGSNLEKSAENSIHIAYTYTLRSFLNDLGADDEDTDEIVDHIMRIRDLDMCLYLREGRKANTIKGSFRSASDKLDCSKIVASLNGGGHARAAGFNLDGSLEDVKQKAFAEVAKHL